MIKKSISVLLCLLLLLPVLAHAEQGKEAEIYFKADFEDSELPSGSDVTFGDGFIYAEDGRLMMEASETYPPVSTVLFPYNAELNEYVYECDITVLSALSENCWFSLCFSALNEDILYQFTVKYGADREDGVSIQYKNGSSSWKQISSASLSEAIGENKIDPGKFSGGSIKNGSEFRISVVVKNGMAFGCIDGIDVVEGGLPLKRYGKVGISGHGISIAADNVTVSSDIPGWISDADSFLTGLYVPDTGIIEPPTVIQRDRQSLPSYSETKQRPASVMMTVRESGGKLHAYDGAVDLGELEERIKLFYKLVIPTFYVSDTLSASMLSDLIGKNGYSDCFVIAAKASLLEEFKNNIYVRTLVDMSSRDSVNAAEISGALYSNGCRAVVLSESAADEETIFELHKRLITVWVSGSAGVDSLFDSAVNGCDGVVTSESSAVLSVFEKVKDTVTVRRRVVVYDATGDGENTVRNVVSALDKGVFTVRVGVGYTGERTTVISGTGVPVEDLLEAVYKEYPSSVLHLDIKDRTAFSFVYGLLKEYDMSNRCVVLSGDTSVLSAAAAENMAYAYTNGPYTVDGRGLYASLSSLCRTLRSLNSAYYAKPEGMPDELISLMLDRGIFVCVDHSCDGVIPVMSGCPGFTVSAPSQTAKLASSLEATADKDGRLSAKVRYYDGTELDVTALCDIITVSGEVKLSGGTVTGDGVFSVICPQTTDDGEKYSICSRLIKISEDPADTENTDHAQSSDGNTLTIVIIVVSSAAAVAGVIILLYLSGKKRKNEKKQSE